MKIKVDCDSPLLQESLEIFLKEFISEDGVVISDNPQKGDIIIGEDIKKPFSKTSLLLQLEQFSIKFQKTPFEEALDNLIDDFSENLKNLVKEYYGKK